jgi:two-component system response regulator AtoC
MEQRLQAKLLRVLQEGVIEPIGSNRRIPVDVRVVSSTNRDLEAAIQQGEFREDLFYRLNVFRLELPPLRDRIEDIPALAANFLRQFGLELSRGELALTESGVKTLMGYDWRGNVRELRNIMERASVLTEGTNVEESLIRTLLPETSESAEQTLDLSAAVADTERRVILRALAVAGDNKTKAAELLGIGERTLWTKLKKHDI